MAISSALAAIGPAHATEERFGQWTYLNVEAPLTEETSLLATLHRRTEPDSFDTQLFFLRGGLQHKFAPGWTLQLTYEFRNAVVPDGPDQIEHRLTQTIAHNFGEVGPGKLDGRIQLEERFFNGSGDTGYRVRERVRYTLPVSRSLDVQFSEELIGGLNRTETGQDDGLGTIRLNGGLVFPIAKNIDIYPHYRWQRNIRRDAADTIDHLLMIDLNLKL